MNNCPRCNYSLEGLPEEHACPECGLEYHGDTTFVRLRSRQASWKQLVIAPIATSWIAFDRNFRAQPFGEFMFRFWLFMILLSFAVYFYRSTRDEIGEFIVDRKGVRLLRPKSGSQVFEPSEIERAKYSRWTGRLTVFGLGDENLFSIKHWELGGQSVASECARMINQLVLERQSSNIGSRG